jgi:hypothetical protein
MSCEPTMSRHTRLEPIKYTFDNSEVLIIKSQLKWDFPVSLDLWLC